MFLIPSWTTQETNSYAAGRPFVPARQRVSAPVENIDITAREMRQLILKVIPFCPRPGSPLSRLDITPDLMTF
jgi:hypothetical protein